mgnify:CR=1 FL=1
MSNKNFEIKQEIVTDKVEGKILGQRVSAPKQYCPEILVRVPRSENRTLYGIQEDNLPFHGYDVWNAYEVSCLTEKGLPIFCQAKIVYPCTSKYIVESKSLKLYLNSFNMMKYGRYSDETKRIISKMIAQDLSSLLECDVKVHLFDEEMKNENAPLFTQYRHITDFVNLDDIEFKEFNEAPQLLKIDPETNSSLFIKFPLLRSNCKITHQPDWGTAFIHIDALYNINIETLVQYLVSFRGENHFHEECCEMIFKRLFDLLTQCNETFDLAVSCIYTRRGGIDICPTRYTNPRLADNNLIQPTVDCQKLLNQ